MLRLLNIVALVAGFSASSSAPQLSWNKDLQWTTMPLGQGVGNLFQCPTTSTGSSESFIVDLGHGGADQANVSVSALKAYLQPADISYIFVSHPNEKNYDLLYQVFPTVADLPGLQGILLGGQKSCYNKNMQAWLSLFSDKVEYINDEKPCYMCKTLNSKDLCKGSDESFSLDILAANLGTSKNARSLLTQVSFNEKKLLIPGNLEGSDNYDSVINNVGVKHLRSDVLQLSHGGTATLANTQNWLNAVNAAKYIVSSEMRDSTSKHPSCATIRRIEWIPLSKLGASEPHTVQCGEPFSSYSQYQSAIYQTMTFTSTNIEMFFTKVTVGSAGLDVKQTIADSEWIDTITALDIIAQNIRTCDDCVTVISGMENVTPNDTISSLKVTLAVDSESIGFGESFGDMSAIMQQDNGIFTVTAQHEGKMDFLFNGCDGVHPLTIRDPMLVVTSPAENKDNPSKWKTEVYASLYTPTSFVTRRLYCMISPSPSQGDSPVNCQIQVQVADLSFETVMISSSECAQTSALEFILEESSHLDAFTREGDASPAVLPSSGSFKAFLPLYDNPDPTINPIDTVTSSPETIRIADMNGVYDPNGTTIFRIRQDPTFNVSKSIGPFLCSIKDAHLEIFVNPPGSAQKHNFSGGMTLDVDFPFFGPDVEIAAKLEFPITTNAPFYLNVSMPPTPKTLNIGFSGSIQYYGKYNPNNMGYVGISIPGLGDFSTSTKLPANLSLTQIPLLIPDYFSGLSYNRTTGKYLFEGFAGTASAALGRVDMKRASYRFKRFIDDLLPNSVPSNASADEIERINKKRQNSIHRRRFAAQAVRNLGLRSYASFHEQLVDDDDADTSFPSIPLPPVNFDDLGGAGCLEALFGSDKTDVIFHKEGDLKDIIAGLPMRFVLPPGLLNSTAMYIEHLFGFNEHNRVKLENITIDIRKLETSTPKGNVVYEGVIASSIIIDELVMYLYLGITTEPLGSDTSKCVIPSPVNKRVSFLHDTSSALSIENSAVRLYMLELVYISPFIDVNGTVYGVNSECPNRILVGEGEAVLPLVSVNSQRKEIKVKAWYNLCNSSATDPRWRLESSGLLTDFEVFGKEISLFEASMAAVGYRVDPSQNTTEAHESIYWKLHLDGEARNFVGIDEISVAFTADYGKNLPVFMEAMLSINSTLLHDKDLRITGLLNYTRNQSAYGDVSLDLRTGFGHVLADGSFNKDVPLGSNGRFYTWKVDADIKYLELGVITIKKSFLSVRCVPRNFTEALNQTVAINDIVGEFDVEAASLSGQNMLLGTADISFNGTKSANVTFNYHHESTYLALDGSLELVLPATGPNARAQGSVNVTLRPTPLHPQPAQFSATLTWCNNVTCGDAMFDAETGYPLYFDRVKGSIVESKQIRQGLLGEVGRPLSSIHQMALLSQMTAQSGKTSIIVEGQTKNWKLGPFFLEKLALSMRCEDSICVGQVMGQTTIGNELGVSVSSMFSTQLGFQELVFSTHETTGFMVMSAMLKYDLGNITERAYRLEGNATVVFNLPKDGNGLPAPKGVANAEFGAKDVDVVYEVEESGNVSISISGKLEVKGTILDFSFTRTDSKCWNGLFRDGSFGIEIKCGEIDLEGYISFRKKFKYLTIETNATLLYGDQRPVPGCKHTFAGNGSSILDFNLPHLDIPRINFRMNAVGCSHYYEAILEVETAEEASGMVVPLGHSNLKIGHLGAMVSYIMQPGATSPELKVALVGTVGGSIQSNTALDIVIAFEPQKWIFAGILKGPTTLGGLISQLAPGVSVSHLDPSNYLGLIDNALVTLGHSDDTSVMVAFQIEAFGVANCTAQMTIGGDQVIQNGTASVSVFIEIDTLSGNLPAPLNKLGNFILGHQGEISLVFALSTQPINPTSTDNPAQNILDFLKDFEVVGKSHDLHLSLMDQNYKQTQSSKLTSIQNPEISTLLARARSVAASFESEPLPGVGQGDFGPGLLAAVKLSSGNEKFSSLKKNVDNTAAFADSMPTTPELEMIAEFNWDVEELKLALRLAISHQITTRAQKHVHLESLMLLADLKKSAVEMGFGIEMSYTTRHDQVFMFEGDVLVTSEADLDILLTAWSSKVWSDPLGISPNLAILFPVQFGLGINLPTGVPDYLQLAGGLSILGQRAYAYVALHFDNNDQAACFSVEEFDLHKLVAAIFCSKGDCLPHALEVLTSISLELGYIKVNTGSSAVMNAKIAGPCQSLPIGFKMDLQELDLFKIVNVQEMCLAVNEKDKDISSLVELDPINLGPLHLTKSHQKQCQDIPLPSDGSCPASKPANGPLLMLHANTKQLDFAFDGRMNVLGFDVDACMRVTPSSFYTSIKLNLSRSISFDALLAASYTKNPPTFDFEVRADLYTVDGLIEAIKEGAEDLFHDINVDLEKGAADAKKALSKAQLGVQHAKAALKRAQKAVGSKLSGLLSKLSRDESEEKSEKATCKYYDHKCGFFHPVKCVRAGACWIKYGVIEAGLKIAEAAVKAAKAVVETALKAAEGALSAANGVLEGFKLAVDAAVGAIELMERLVTEALKALASLFDIKTLNLYAALHKKTVKGSFHMVGRVLTKPFDVSFAASIDFTNIKTMALSAVKSVLTSIFGNVGKKEIKDLSEIEGLLRLGSGDFGDSSSNISHSLQYFLPKPLHHSEPLIQRPTGMIFTPSATGSAFEMEELCRAVLSALKNIDHTAVYVDLSNLPGTCSLPATVGANNTLQQVPCINKVIEQCLSPGSIHMHKRKAFYHSAESTRLEVATHHKQYMSKLMQTCESSKCHDLAHDLATDTWSVSFKANDAAGSGLIPKLPDVSADIPVRYSFDLSDNSYHGDIPDLNGPGLHSLNLAGNWITGGLQNIAAAKNLQSLDLSNNYGLSHDGECIADTLKKLTALSHFNFQGNDRLVPSEPIRCTRQRVIDTAGIHLVEELAHDSLVVGGICGGCDTNLAPFGCLGFPCMNASLLELQIDSILEKAQEVVAAEDLNIEQLSRDMIEILNFDQPSNGTGFYVTYTIKPSQANAEERPFSLAQARSFSQLMGKKPEIVANTTACQPGLAGPNCDIECYYGWERTSAIPPTDDSEHEIKSHRLPRCHTPVTFDTCPNSTLVAALRDVTEHCDGTQTPKSKELCLEALYPAVGLLKSTQATADIPQNLTLANYFCNETALNMITEPCARAVIPVYSYATLCSPPPGNDDNNNKKAVLKVWHIVLIACAGAMILLSGVGVGVRRWYKSKGEQNQAQSEGDHGISPEYQNLPDHDDHHHKPGTWVQEPSLDPILEEPETEIDRAHRSSLGGEIISH